jgi:hypothetical protein
MPMRRHIDQLKVLDPLVRSEEENGISMKEGTGSLASCPSQQRWTEMAFLGKLW